MIKINFICDFCGQSERGKGYLQRHLDKKHRKFHCSVCQRVYSKKENILDHLRAHFERFICQYCGVEISKLEQFQKHVYQQHEPDNKKLILSIQSQESYKCRYCIRTFPSAVRRNGHETNVHKNRNDAAFKCQECQTVFITKDELRTHSFEHYAGNLHFCAFPSCDRFFKTTKQLKSHTLIHEPARFQCDRCKQRFTQSSNFSRHKKRCKGEVTTAAEIPTKDELEKICEVAKQQFTLLGGTLKHSKCKIIKQLKEDRVAAADDLTKTLEVHNAEELSENKNRIAESSSIRSSRNASVLIRSQPQTVAHSRRAKRGLLENLICHVCAFQTSTQRQLRSHIDQEHRNKSTSDKKILKTVRIPNNFSSKLSCDVCGVVKTKKFKLRKHMQCHIKALEECEICHLKLRNVHKHIKDVHNDERSFVCGVCNAAFKTSHNLKNHVKTHEEPSECTICHKFLPNMDRHLQWHKRPTPARHKCPQCSKSCSTKQAMQEHVLRIHEKVPLGKSYTCQDCGLNFIRNHELRRHSYLHYTGKIFSCNFRGCNEMFKKSFKLQLHMMTHNPSNERKFECKVCDRKYLSRAALNKHQRQRHSDQLQ